MKVHAPNTQFNGTVAGVEFADGVATVDKDTSPAVVDYFRRHGYGLGKKASDPDDTPEPPDPRDIGDGKVGTPLRDAAVDPRKEDFLPPINAGKANPHGPEVVAPHVHGSPDRRITPGDVAVEDTDAQEAKETAHAEDTILDEDHGDGPPAKSANKPDWVAYAISRGADPTEAEDATKNQLIEIYGGDA